VLCNRPALHFSEVAKSSTSFAGDKGGNATAAGWHVTLCYSISRVSQLLVSLMRFANCYTPFTYLLIYFIYLLTYLMYYSQILTYFHKSFTVKFDKFLTKSLSKIQSHLQHTVTPVVKYFACFWLKWPSPFRLVAPPCIMRKILIKISTRWR